MLTDLSEKYLDFFNRAFNRLPLGAVLGLIGDGSEVKRVAEGIYKIPHFSFDTMLQQALVEIVEKYPTIGDLDALGVCDYPEQIVEKCPELVTDERNFVISVTHLAKTDEPEKGGWRWHKWGEYIGDQKPQCEYLYDEPDVEEVWCFHIYEIVPA